MSAGTLLTRGRQYYAHDAEKVDPKICLRIGRDERKGRTMTRTKTPRNYFCCTTGGPDLLWGLEGLE